MMARRTRAKPPLDGWVAASLGLTAFYLIAIILPIFGLLRSSLDAQGGSSISFKEFETFFSSKLYYGSLFNSFYVTICVTVLALVVAFPLAYILANFKIRGGKTVQILILASMMSPPFIGAYSWIILLGNNGLIRNFFKDNLGITMPPIYGFAGILLVLTLQLVPLIFTYLMGAWRTLDVSVLEAAESMGSTGLNRIRRVIFPLLVPTVLAGSLMVSVRAFADFGTPMLIGQGFRTVPVLIYSSFVGEVGTSRGFASAVAVIVVVLTVGIFLVQRYLVARGSYTMHASRRIVPKRLSMGKSVLAHGVVYGFVFLALVPLIVVAFSSFRKTLYGQFTDGFSLDNYERASDDIVRLLLNTLKIGLTALVLLVIVAVIVSYLNVRRPSFLNGLLDSFTMVPYVVPGLVIGIAMVVTFSSPPVKIAGTMTIMVLALMLRRLSYTVRSTTALLYQQSPSIEEAAQSLGASKIKTLLRVVVPMLAPGILSGAILSWVTIITELSTTLFLYNTSTQTLSLGIYAEVIRGQMGTSAALSTILLAMTILSLFIFMKLPGSDKEAAFG